MDEHLKPCPFCGEVAVSRIEALHPVEHEARLRIYVMCSRCGTAKSEILKFSDTSFLSVQQKMDEVVQKWNARAAV